MSDTDRDKAIEDHVEWAHQERERAAEKLKLIEAGAIRHHRVPEGGGDPTDHTEEYKAELEHLVDKLGRIIFAFAPR